MIGTFTFAGLIAGLLLAATGLIMALSGETSSWADLTRLVHIFTGWLGFIPLAILSVHHRRLRGDQWDGTVAGVALGLAVLSGLLISLMAVVGVAPFGWLVLIHIATTWACIIASVVHVGMVLQKRRNFLWAERLLLPAGVAIVVLILVSARINFWLHSVTASPSQLAYKTPFEDSAFKPANVILPSEELLHPAHLSGSARCGECHKEIYSQWSESMHRFSASDPHVDTGIRWFQRDNGVASGRFCAGCHNPIALLSGAYDLQVTPEEHGTPAHDEGISCLVCHATVKVSEDPLGNGSYELKPPAVPFMSSGWWSRLLVHTDIAGHKARVMKRPLFQSALFCASCHQQYTPEAFGGDGPSNSINQYPEWLESHYSDEGSDGFKSCQDCHMPLIEADDPAAVGGKIHSHRFIGANFAHARSAGFEEQERLTMAMLKGAVTLSVGLAVDQPRALHATIEVRVKNTGTGHRFPSGTTDISEAWLEVVAGSQALPTFASGLLDSNHYLDPKAHSWRTIYVDKFNLPVDLHNLAAVHDTPLDNYIEPGKTDVAKFEIPLSGTEPISVRIRLRLRKANQRWTDWLTNFDGRTEPIADIHEKTLSIDPGKLKWSTPALPPEKKTPESALPQIPSMVLVPAGQAILGSDRGDSDEAPMQKVEIEAFYMDRMPVTNSQYRRYLRATQKQGPAHKIGWAEKYNWKGRKYPPGSADQPAILISWEEAKAYCTWRGKRLPREAEWEKAARGPNGFTYPWGNHWEDGACAILDGVEVPPRVGMCPNRASPYGVLDMVGGVYEWTADLYMAYSRSSLHRNANEWITVFGGYAFALRGVPSGQIGPATTASSRSGHADNMRARIGFRCAQDGQERRSE